MSNRMKHEVKALTYHEIGMSLDDSLDQAQKEKQIQEGAKMAFVAGKKHVEDLLAHVDRDVKEGILDLDQATLAKKWVVRAGSILQNLGLQAEVQGHIAQGKIAALTAVVRTTKSLYDAEKVRLEASSNLEGEIDPRRPDARASGEHPGNPIADRKSDSTEGTQEVNETLLVVAPKKRGRRKDAADT